MTREDLAEATARTAAVIADPSASRGDVERAAELEQAVYLACPDDVVAAYEAETKPSLRRVSDGLAPVLRRR